MSFRNRLVALPLALFLGVSLCLSRSASAQYSLTQFLSSSYEPLALNNNGQVLEYGNYSYYLLTNGVHQFVSESSYSFNSAFLNQKGQVLGVDRDDNIFLYTNGVKQIIASLGNGEIYGLNDNGEAVWSASYDASTFPTTIYAYQNGVTQNLGQHTILEINNAGQILGANEFYSNFSFW